MKITKKEDLKLRMRKILEENMNMDEKKLSKDVTAFLKMKANKRAIMKMVFSYDTLNDRLGIIMWLLDSTNEIAYAFSIELLKEMEKQLIPNT